MSSLFDSEISRMAAVPGTRRLAEDEDPFGEDNIPPRDEVFNDRVNPRTISIADSIDPQPKWKKADHNLRSREFYIKQGYSVFRVDQTRTSYTGAIYTVDFLGIWDWMALKPGSPPLGIQVCAEASIGSHISGMCSEEQTSFNKAKKVDNLRLWLMCGLEGHVLGWKKVGRLWQPTVRVLTMEDITSREERRAKRAAKSKDDI